jgi:hypothetical protein
VQVNDGSEFQIRSSSGASIQQLGRTRKGSITLNALTYSWDILSFAGTQDGSGFSNINFENAGSEHFTAFFNGQNLEFVDNTGSVNAPEPSSLAMMSIANLAGLAPLQRASG